MNKFITPAFVEALKELLRVMVLAAIPNILLWAESGTADLRVLATSVAIAALRFIDKWMHEAGKDGGNTALEGGLTRF